MPSDLRQQVNELEATVRGLTQELVEANERINHLETLVDDVPAESSAADTGEEDPTQSEESGDADIDDIIVA